MLSCPNVEIRNRRGSQTLSQKREFTFEGDRNERLTQ
jgi:hypothetical protein